MRHLSIFLFLAIFAAVGCSDKGGEKKAADTETEERAPLQSKLNADGTNRLANVLLKYYELKNALVKTDGLEAADKAQQLAMVATDLRATTISDSVASVTLSVHLDSIKLSSLEIAAAHPGDVEAMRASFEQVSNNMYALLKKAELQNANVYRQFCPMAFDSKGAYWLSEEEVIKNPYFGDKMMSCGEVKETLK